MIVSNNAEPAIEAFLDHHDLRHLVHTVIGRVPGRPELMKPHPDSVLGALDILDRPPAQCVLIGDSVTDIEVSRATSRVPMPSPTQTLRWPSPSATARQRARRPWRYPAAHACQTR